MRVLTPRRTRLVLARFHIWLAANLEEDVSMLASEYEEAVKRACADWYVCEEVPSNARGTAFAEWISSKWYANARNRANIRLDAIGLVDHTGDE